MKTLLRLTLLSSLLLILSCNDDNTGEEMSNDCILPQGFIDTAETIDFKRLGPNHTVQVPENYEGQGIYTTFEGDTFYKYLPNTSTSDPNDYLVFMDYIYCSGTYCYPYGRTLENPVPESTSFWANYFITGLPLTERIDICQDLDVYGYFYHTESPHTDGFYYGQYYMHSDGEFLEAVSFRFIDEKFDEVLNIIKSIKRV